MPLNINHPHPTGLANPAVVRAWAALPAAGAWDAAPEELPVQGFWWVRLYFTYQRGLEDVQGELAYYYELSPYATDALANNEAWFHGTIYAPGTQVPCAITHSWVQQEFMTYCATTNDAETFISPPIHLGGCVERFRLFCREDHNLPNPGSAEVIGLFYVEG